MTAIQQPPSFQVGSDGPSVNYFQAAQSPWSLNPQQHQNIRLHHERPAEMVAPPIQSQPGSSAGSHQAAALAPNLVRTVIGPGGIKISPLIRGYFIVTR